MPRLCARRSTLLAAAAFLVLPSAALAGTITGTAYLDRNSGGAFDTATFTAGPSGVAKAGDIGVGGVTVNAYDATGTLTGTATTASNGTYSLTTATSGAVRVEFVTAAGYQPSFMGGDNGTSVRFVGATASGVDFGMVKPSDYCQDSPGLVTCSPPFKDSMSSSPTTPGGIYVPTTLNQITADAQGSVTAASSGGTTIANNSVLGSVFGVGLDRQRNAYFGTYVKRHSAYGPSGATNTVYRRNLDTGTAASVSAFVTLPGTLPAHSAAAPTSLQPGSPPDYGVDGNRNVAVGQPGYSDVYSKVGRAGLGDVDVAPDGSNLYAIDMDEAAPKLWAVPITGTGAAVTAGTPTSTAIPTPATFGGVPCVGKWHPMGIGLRDDRVLVGGVCGAEDDGPRWYIASANRTSNVVTVTTSTAHGLATGDIVNVTTGTASFDGTNIAVTGAPTATTFTYAKTGSNGSAGVTATSNVIRSGATIGNASTLLFTAARASNVVTATTLSAHGLRVGDRVQVTTDTAGFNGVVDVTAVPSSTQFRYTSTGANGSATISVGSSGAVRTTRSAAFVLEFSGGSFSTVAAYRLDYLKASAGNNQILTPPTTLDTGAWHSWTDAAPPWPDPPSSDVSSYGQPMLSNIEILDNGDLVVSMRDRYMDQVAVSGAVSYESSLTLGAETILTGGFGAADTLRLCASGGTYAVETNGACGATTGARQPNLFGLSPQPSPLFYWVGYWDGIPCDPGNGSLCYAHNHTSIGGTATMPGSSMLWTTAYDLDGINQQGVKALGACASAGTCGPVAANGSQVAGTKFDTVSATFQKGNGLGDLELLCDAAPVQIGNRVWIDSNANGVQDPGEPAVAGVTVHLYNGANTLVGTALTDSSGTYYFSSNVSKPAAGDGTNVGGGLVTGAPFTIRLDKPQDYVAGVGPLAPYDLTAATQASGGSGSQSTAVDSNATLVSSYPQISVPARTPGQNNHTFDVGFITTANPTWPGAILVGMGNFTWVDGNSNGIQDPGEPALAGVQVQLLDASGNVATDALGNAVAPVTTDAQGAYFIGNLLPGTYRAQFTLPSGYTFTTAQAGTSANDSNPTAGANPLVGTTPTFTITAAASGDTTAVTGHSDASFANLTIDAGVIASSGGAGSGGGASGGGNSGQSSNSAVSPSAGPSPSGGPLTPFQGGAIVPTKGIPSDGGGRIWVLPENPLDTPVESMTTVIVVPKGLTIISADGGTILGRTITYTDRNVPANGRRAHAVYVRATGTPRTVKIPVTVRVSGSSTVQRTVLRVKVRAARSVRPAVTG